MYGYQHSFMQSHHHKSYYTSPSGITSPLIHNMPPFIYFFTDEILSKIFPFFSIVNKVAINIYLHVFIYTFFCWPSWSTRVRNAVLGCNLKNDRMISVHFQGKPFNITVIQVYAPTINAEEAEVERFYEDLQDLLELTPKKKKMSFSS